MVALFIGLHAAAFLSCCSTVLKTAGIEVYPPDYLISGEQVEFVERAMGRQGLNNYVGRKLYDRYAIRSQVAPLDLATASVWLTFPNWYSIEGRVFLVFYLSPGIRGRGAATVARGAFGKELRDLSESELNCIIKYVKLPSRSRLDSCAKGSSEANSGTRQSGDTS